MVSLTVTCQYSDIISSVRTERDCRRVSKVEHHAWRGQSGRAESIHVEELQVVIAVVSRPCRLIVSSFLRSRITS